jgi:hypothetical protein
MITLLVILLVVLVVLALAGGPTYVRRLPGRRVVETVYEDEPLVEDEVVEVVDEPVADLRPRRRVRRLD